jgi:hypothetical protein
MFKVCRQWPVFAHQTGLTDTGRSGGKTSRWLLRERGPSGCSTTCCAPIESLGGHEVRCWRLLVRADNAWHPALRLSADGPISLVPGLARGTTRLRATPVGRLADDVTGEIALLDPPGTAGHWMARPRPATPRVPIRGYPFDAAVEVELRCEHDAVGRLRWKGGDPVRGDVLTFYDESGGDEAGHILTFLGSGSCRSRHSPLYVLASTRHVARTIAGQQITAHWTGNAGQLFRLDGTSYVGVPGDDELFYRIERELRPNAPYRSGSTAHP